MKTPREFRDFPTGLIAAYLVFAVCLGVGGFLYYDHQKRQITENKHSELTAIAQLKVNEISRWIKERKGDGRVLVESPMTSRHIQDLLKNPHDRRLLEETRSWMESFKKHFDYSGVFLADTDGNIRLSVPEGGSLSPAVTQRFPVLALSKKPLFLDLQIDSQEKDDYGQISCGLLVPIATGQESGESVIAVLVLKIDPYNFLYPLVESWPTASHTAETLLVRREGDEVVFLNELRHRKNAALRLRRSIEDSQLPAAVVAKGYEGMVDGRDYRGEPVLAAVRTVPDSPWFLVAKIDQAEIYASIRQRGWPVALVVTILIISTGVCLFFIWHYQRAQFYRRQYELEVERLELAERYEFMTRYTTDTLLLADARGQITEVNERAIATYGYTRDEFLRMNIRDVQAPEHAGDPQDQWQRNLGEDGGVFESVHRRRDGSHFPVEVSARTIQLGGADYYWGTIRDITERKQAEEALRQSKERYHKLFEDSPISLWEEDYSDVKEYLETLRDDGARDLAAYLETHPEAVAHCAARVRVIDVNRATLELYGAKNKQELMAARFRVSSEEAYDFFTKGLVALAEGRTRFEYEATNKTLQGEKKYVVLRGTVAPDCEHSLSRVLVSMIDITDRKKAEEGLRNAHDELELRVAERTIELTRVNEQLRNEIGERKLAEEALRESERQLRLLSSRLFTIQEEERKRIARELHDSIGSALSAIKFGMESYVKSVTHPSPTCDPITTLISLSQQTIEEVRRIMADLRPSMLDDLGLVATIGWLCRQFQLIYPSIGVTEEISIREEDIPEPLKIVIFRLIQEAFHNIAKYSGAEQVNLSLSKIDRAIDLCIEDSGGGFDLNAIRSEAGHQKGLGLASMRERTELSGGSFHIASVIGEGTLIRASWPTA